MSLQRMDGTPRYAHAIRHGQTIYLSGQVPEDLDGDVGSQARQVLSLIDSLLERFESHKGKLVSATLYLRDIAMLSTVNEVWQAWVLPDMLPTRTVVEARLSDSRCCIEITAVAAV